MKIPVALTAFLSMILTLAACGPGPADEPAGVSAPQAISAGLERSPAPEGARVFFESPADGAMLENPVVVEFGVSGIALAKAGDERPSSGHHHLIIDAGLPDPGRPIPADEHYLHFGDASSRTELTLAPGTHTLQLLLGDHRHVPHDPPVASEVITITVE